MLLHSCKNSYMPANPLISVCIPVYNAEKTLLECILSAALQDFEKFEILVVNDGSPGKDDNGNNCKKLVKLAEKQSTAKRKKLNLSKISIKYIEHKTNLGLVEARRTAVEYAKGEYICCLDSDDFLLPDALASLYQTASTTNADIVQGKTDTTQKYYNVFLGSLEGPQIFDGYIKTQNHSGFLWAKLIRRQTYLKALSYIPFTNCVMAEDLLQYFFISYEAKKYEGIDKIVYHYSTNSGISSNKQIDSLARWEQVCSTANVFTIIFSKIAEMPENSFTLEQLEALRLQSRSLLLNNLQQLKHNVVPQLRDEAYSLLCDYWGSDFVEFVERSL